MVGGFTCWHYFLFHAFIPSLSFSFSTFFLTSVLLSFMCLVVFFRSWMEFLFDGLIVTNVSHDLVVDGEHNNI
jgi:hypothetical protein